MLWLCEVQLSPSKQQGAENPLPGARSARQLCNWGSDLVLQADAADSISGGDAQASAQSEEPMWCYVCYVIKV
jgi:hypothetical protein